MHNAIVENLNLHSSVLIIGCDCPELGIQDLHDAITALKHDKDVVIGPSEDGGYYLIGMNHDYPELFTGIEWGSANVIDQTRRRTVDLELNITELDMKWDVDRPEDVYRYMRLQGHSA
jgi:glycosyltransferase A (GT-A) superfamily protein (DUF2064 family)